MNSWCEALKIDVPKLEAVKDHRDANTYALLLVVLLERGEPMTLEAVAERFDEAGVAPREIALQSLKRCQPGRAPVYRDGDRYAIDPHSDELSLWTFRLGLRGPRLVMQREPRPAPAPLGGPQDPLTPAELEEGLKRGWLVSWSPRRLAIAVLDAHGGSLAGAKVVEIMDQIAERHGLKLDSPQLFQRGSPLTLAEDGIWQLDRSHAAVEPARAAVRQRIEVSRRYDRGPTVSEREQHSRRIDEMKAARATELAKLRRVLVCAFPVKAPIIVTLVDVSIRELTTFMGPEIEKVGSVLAAYDVIGAIDVRAVLRGLDFDAEDRRLAELGPPQKTRKLNKRGRTLKITPTLLVQGSCGISKPFGDQKKLTAYVAAGDDTKLRRRIESDAKSLYAMYQYGRLHGGLRLRWGFLDEMIPAPWVHRDEPTLYELMRTAGEDDLSLEVVVGSAPAWVDPWSRVIPCRVEPVSKYRSVLMTDDGRAIDEMDVQLARLPETELMA
jgi:hypothetical protein